MANLSLSIGLPALVLLITASAGCVYSERTASLAPVPPAPDCSAVVVDRDAVEGWQEVGTITAVGRKAKQLVRRGESASLSKKACELGGTAMVLRSSTASGLITTAELSVWRRRPG